ncbi:MAG: Ig-like domain-containing protein [Bacteroidota bacterium]
MKKVITLLLFVALCLLFGKIQAQAAKMDCSSLMDNLVIQDELDISSSRRAIMKVSTQGAATINAPDEFVFFEAEEEIVLGVGFEAKSGNLFHARLAQCTEVVDPCGGIPVWMEGETYVGGDEAQLNGKKYRANWWTQDNPETNNGPTGSGQPWTLLGDCTGDFNRSPTVNVTAPSDGTTLQENTDLTITADASDNDGTITQVEFFVDDMSVSIDMAAPYSVVWTTTGLGNHEIKAISTDDEGATSPASIVQINVTSEGGNSCTGVNTWMEDGTYVQGDEVQLNGKKYRANWWTQSNPETNNGLTGSGQPWTLIGDCDGTPSNTPPTISITAPTNMAVFIAGETISITADASDSDGMITQVEFFADDQSLGIDMTSPFEYAWTDATWGNYVLTAVATDDDGATTTSDPVDISVNDGNERPVVEITAPDDGASFMVNEDINITATASDSDGTISKVEFFSQGSKIGEDLTAPYELTWSSASTGNFSLTAVATDNDGGTTTSAVVRIFVTDDGMPTMVDLPKHILVGYWHNFNNGSTAPPLGQVTTDWDVVDIAFAIPATPGGADMTFTPDPSITTDAQFRQDVQTLQNRGQKVLISIGGATGAIELLNPADAQEFATAMIDIIEDYGFDGLDIDLEGSSLSLEFGDNDFTQPTSPKIVNFISGMEMILNHFGEDLVLSAAPETAFVQGGRSTYAGLFGAYLPVIYQLRNDLDFIHVQHYNSGCMLGLDGVCYAQGTADFHVAMAEMLLQGFPVAGHTINFPALREDQVAFGIPASPQAAGGGYTTPTDVIKALDYIIKGIPFGGNYTLVQPAGYPNMRGLMTWSINWDLFNNDEFVLNYRPYFDNLLNTTENRSEPIFLEQTVAGTAMDVFPNPSSGQSHIAIHFSEASDAQILIYDEMGKWSKK